MDNDDLFIKLDAKLDKVVDHLGSIDVTLAKQHEILDYHVMRTNLLEKQIAPIQKHVFMIHGAFKVFGVVAVLAGILEGFSIFLEYLKK